MLVTAAFFGLALASAIASALCFSTAGAASENPQDWHIDPTFTQVVGAAALIFALGLTLALGMRI